MKKEATTFEEAEAIINPLVAENKWAITVMQNADGTFTIQWLEHKKYTAQDGKEFHDEIWTTKEGEMKLVQDLEPEHARNILRMLLRKDREATQAMNALFQQAAEGLLEGLDEDGYDEDEEELFPNFSNTDSTNKTLH